MASPWQAQNVLIVDGTLTNPSPPYYASISSAVAAAVEGDTILVKGMVVNGNPMGYSETTTNEVFPITVMDKDLSIEEYGANPVYVYSVQGHSLFQINAAVIAGAGAGAGSITLKGFDLIGSRKAVEILGDLAARATVTCDRLRFSHNEVGVYGAATDDADLALQLGDCSFMDLLPNLSPPPGSLLTPHKGVVLRASSLNGDAHGTLTASLENLVCQGNFDGTDQLADSTLVEIVVTPGDEPEYPFGLFPAQKIPRITVDFSGGNLEGLSDISASGGWNRGITILSEDKPFGGGDAGLNYFSAFRVSFNGTKVSKFLQNGIWCRSGIQSEGRLYLNGGTRILDTGASLVSGVVDGTGVYLESEQTYLGFKATDTRIYGNAGHGVFARCFSITDNLYTPVPVGLYFGLERSEVGYSGKDGIYLVADDPSMWGVPAFVGGTVWFAQRSSYSVRAPQILVSPPAYFGPLQGLGMIHECIIHNNAKKAIHLEVGGPYASPLKAVGSRIVDNFIWNNAEEGWFVSLGDGAQMLVGTAHCTSAGNGYTGTRSVDAAVAAPLSNSMLWKENDPNTGLGHLFNACLRNSIFQRQDTLDDLSTNVLDISADSMVNTFEVRMLLSGLRSSKNYQYYSIYLGSDPTWTDATTPFVLGPGFSWGTADWEYFKLNPAGGTFPAFDNTGPIGDDDGKLLDLLSSDLAGGQRDTGNPPSNNKGAHQAN